jgi:type IV pilus assembly protein PilW
MNQQRGFTLVELMVALVIALLLLAGILQILLSNRRSFDAQKTAATLQENSRLASFIIENVVAEAGYRVDLAASNDQIFPKRVAALDDADNPLVIPIAKGAFVAARYGDKQGNDAIRLRFQAAGGVHDCTGKQIRDPNDPSQPATADFALMVTSDHTLRCVLYNDNDIDKDTDVGVKSKPPLVNNVDRFKIRYGLDSDNDDSVDTYVNTLDDTTAKQVRSIRIQLLLESKNNVSPSPVSQTYTFLDSTQTSDDTQTFNDRHARILLDQTITLRNLLP